MLDVRQLKVELQSCGVKVNLPYKGRRGGAGPAAGKSIFIEDVVIEAPTMGGYVNNSPFTINFVDGRNVLFKNDEEMCPVIFSKIPNFYEKRTEDGIPYSAIALIHGSDCLATTVIQTCKFWNPSKRCKFCGIQLSLNFNATIERKTPQQLAEVASSAWILDGTRNFTITSGVSADPEDDIIYIAKCVKEIKKEFPYKIHVQVYPTDNLNDLRILYDAGVNTLGLHIESFDTDVLENMAPPKALIGVEGFFKIWRGAVEIFGRNQVSTFILIGLGEEERTIYEGCQAAADIGVYPYVIPFRPIPGTLLENWSPPDPQYMYRVYQRVAAILREKNIKSQNSFAGCVNCHACAALHLFEN